MRGTLLFLSRAGSVFGIIPAYAGNTYVRRGLICISWDHPRVCGEHIFGEIIKLFAQGSSPRMRGTLAARIACQALDGIIPAYAGNTCSSESFSREHRDHPRVCGEHESYIPDADDVRGSSPRMRGTRHHGKANAVDHGIIPAYAGNTVRLSTAWPAAGDHPRVCGEHVTVG